MCFLAVAFLENEISETILTEKGMGNGFRITEFVMQFFKNLAVNEYLCLFRQQQDSVSFLLFKVLSPTKVKVEMHFSACGIECLSKSLSKNFV